MMNYILNDEESSYDDCFEIIKEIELDKYIESSIFTDLKISKIEDDEAIEISWGNESFIYELIYDYGKIQHKMWSLKKNIWIISEFENVFNESSDDLKKKLLFNLNLF